MKFFRIFGRSIRDSFKSVFRNFSLTLASISCITITLVIVGISLIISYNVDYITKELKSDLSIVTFISNDANTFDISNIETQIKGIDNVKSVTFKSKADTKKEMMDSTDTFESIMKDWDDNENPLQNIYIVKVKDVNKISETAVTIKNLSNVTLVKYGEGMVEQLLVVFNSVEKASFIAVIALVIVTVFLIINTIKLTIFSRKREISIMRLVGASNTSIKLPFVFEGIFIGILGSIIPLLIVTVGYSKVYKYFGGKILTDIIDIIPPTLLIFKVSLLVILIGIVVGMIGSSSAVRKYLKV